MRACIKVKFKDVLGNEITCLRIVQSTQKVHITGTSVSPSLVLSQSGMISVAKKA